MHAKQRWRCASDGRGDSWLPVVLNSVCGNGDRLNNGHRNGASQPKGRDWRRIHHSPLFWIGVALCLAAILIYVLSDDLSWRPVTK
jgi:hypothetical protein